MEGILSTKFLLLVISSYLSIGQLLALLTNLFTQVIKGLLSIINIDNLQIFRYHILLVNLMALHFATDRYINPLL